MNIKFTAGLILAARLATAREPVDAVNPFIGAGSLEGIYNGFHGKNFPGAATPAGMVQLSPHHGGRGHCGPADRLLYGDVSRDD